MQNTRIYHIVILIILLSILTACRDNINNDNCMDILNIIDNSKEKNELIKQSYDVQLLKKIPLSSKIEDVEKITKIECIRKVYDILYNIFKIKNDGGFYYVFYLLDNKDKSWKVINTWHYIKPLKKEDFDNLKVGKSTYYDVQKIDPSVELFYGGRATWTDIILSDFNRIFITYDENLKIKTIEITEETDNSIFRKILKIDWPA